MNTLKQLTTAAIVAVGFLCVPFQLMAQSNTTKLDTTKVYSLGEVIVSASRYKEPPASVGRNVTVIDESQIKKSMQSSVAGLLAEQQSVYVTGQGQTPGSLQTLYLRNANPNQAVVMIDGVRMSDPSSTGNSIDLSELSLAGVKRIEIVRGSQSTLYGSSAIGGVINIITRHKAQAGLHAHLDTQQGSLGGESYFTQNNVSLRGALKNGWYANLAASQKYTPGLDATIDTSSAGGFNPQDKDGFRKLDLYGNIGYQNAVVDIHGSYRRVDQHSQLDQGAYIDDSNARSVFKRNLFQYGADVKLSKKVKLALDGAYSDLDREFVNDSSLVAPGGPYDGSYNETNAEGGLLENNLKTVFKSRHIDFVAGVSANRQTMNTHNYVYSRSPFGVYENTTDLDSLNLHENTYSAYLHTDLRGGALSDEFKNISLVLGARYVHHNQFGSHLTYEVNPKIKVGTALFYGSLTTGFNAPSLYQLYSPSISPGYYTNRGNRHLDPETSVSYELGFKESIIPGVRLNLSLYRTDISNGISYVYLWNKDTPVAGLQSTDYLGDTYINLAKQHINGVDLGLHADVLSNLILSGSLSFSNSNVTFAPKDINDANTGGNHVQLFESGVFVNRKRKIDSQTRRPSIDANIKLDYYPVQALEIGIQSQYIGSRNDIFYSARLGPFGAQDLSDVGGYNVTNVKMQYQINTYINLGVMIPNVFNTQYTEINGYRSQGRGLMVKASFSI